MKNTSKTAALGLTGLLSLTAMPMAQAVDYVPLTSFSTDPTSAGWTKSGVGASWTSGSGYLNASADGWYSPVFNPTPGEYYKVQYDAQLTGTGTAQFGTFFGNPAATYDLEPVTHGLYRKTSTGALYVTGQLLADNYTNIRASTTGWSTITEFTRVPVNATQSFAYFGKDAVGARIDNVRISSATHADVLAWADGIYNDPSKFPVKLSMTLPANRFDNLPKTLAKLEQQKTMSVVMLGDSIMGDTENSGIDAMIERKFPGSNVVVHSAVGHGTGMKDWLYASSYNDAMHNGLKLQEAVYDRNADLVIIGGISNGDSSNWPALEIIVQQLKAQGTEVLLASGCFGNRPGANFVGTIDGTTTGSDTSLPYRNYLYNLAQTEDVGFFDTYGAWGTYLAQLKSAGMTEEAYYRDFWTHADTTGKDMIGRLYEGYFTPVPEPTSLGLLILGGAGLIARRRKAM